jgi:hypothetical protein
MRVNPTQDCQQLVSYQIETGCHLQNRGRAATLQLKRFKEAESENIKLGNCEQRVILIFFTYICIKLVTNSGDSAV